MLIDYEGVSGWSHNGKGGRFLEKRGRKRRRRRRRTKRNIYSLFRMSGTHLSTARYPMCPNIYRGQK